MKRREGDKEQNAGREKDVQKRDKPGEVWEVALSLSAFGEQCVSAAAEGPQRRTDDGKDVTGSSGSSSKFK